MSIEAIITSIVGGVIALLAILFKVEKNKNKKLKVKNNELEKEMESKEIEEEAQTITTREEREISEATAEINRKTMEALNGIHKALEKDQQELYNAKVKGWNKNLR